MTETNSNTSSLSSSPDTNIKILPFGISNAREILFDSVKNNFKKLTNKFDTVNLYGYDNYQKEEYNCNIHKNNIEVEVLPLRIRQMLSMQKTAFKNFRENFQHYEDYSNNYGLSGLSYQEEYIKEHLEITCNGISLVNNESLRETMINLMNYSAIYIIHLDESKEIVENNNICIDLLTKRLSQLQTIHHFGFELFKRKNKDYGDSFAEYGVIGVIIRQEDKIKRILNICKTGMTLVHDESIRDTLVDLMNYSAMAIMCLDDQYEKELANKAKYMLERLTNSDSEKSLHKETIDL